MSFINTPNPTKPKIIMKNWLLRSVKAVVTASLLSLTFQSCTKEVDDVNPKLSASTSSTDSYATLPATCKSVCLVNSQRQYIGTVDAALDNNYLYVTYKITKPNVYLLETNLDVFRDCAQLVRSWKIGLFGIMPDRFAYQACFRATDRRTTFTARIPRSAVDCLNIDLVSIAANAELTNCGVAWGTECDGTSNCVSINSATRFPGLNGGSFFQLNKTECSAPIDFTYAWEDLRNAGNDADYNDLVIKSNVTKRAATMDITFTASARGAGYDHAFKFNLPKTGVTSITGAADVQDNGTFYTVTVFPSTKTALPTSGTSGFANTVASELCVTPATRTVTVNINSTFRYNAARPYEPFISVYISGTASGTPTYDLGIYDLAANTGDTWTDTDGKVYPNGILIPADWKWPLENVRISTVYPTFTSLPNFTPTWANTAPAAGSFSTCD
ncbi:LruC domain-containing protein [Hymenobacter norwichensis]|uniref:LruC domain-containing protein n=1 Tax=Hymenobacter norwichensis TaxID=223903 RepID=UPI00040912E2|nr:LruC domain-containing protein [Hymenobacter norwichensis]